MKRQYYLSGMALQKVTWFVGLPGLPGYAGSDKKGTIASEEETYITVERNKIYFWGVLR